MWLSTCQVFMLVVMTFLTSFTSSNPILLWKTPIKGKGGTKSDPVLSLDERTLFIGANDGGIYSYSTSDGTTKWEFPTDGIVTGGPILSPSGDRIFIGSGDNNLYTLHTNTGNLDWKYTTGGKVLSTSTVCSNGSLVWTGSGDDILYALNASSGLLRWKKKIRWPCSFVFRIES